MLVHFSTNFVFDGKHEEPYVEADEPSPISVYGHSKLEGERRVLETGAHVLLVRTAAVFGGPHSFPQRILDRARSGEKLRVVSDQRVNPTYAEDLAAAALQLVEEGAAGIVHVVARECTGWDDFARLPLTSKRELVDDQAAHAPFGSNLTYALERYVRLHQTSGTTGAPSAAYPSAARRPLNGCLGTTRFPPLRPWREALHEWAAGLK